MAVEPRIEEEIMSWLTRKSIANEQKMLMSENVEEIDRLMAEKDLSVYKFTSPISGELVTATRKEKIKKSLDKTSLAEELEVEKKELDTAGMVKLAEDDILTERHIISHTQTKQKTEIKIKKRKPKEKE